jgi:mannose-6-phosphate isomerase-like protein (cupin superfamily)
MDTATSPTTADLDFLGCRARILAAGGELGLVDMLEVPAGHMPPLHVHHREDEGFYVIDGRIALHLPGRRRIDLGPGEFALAPRGIPHSYEVGDAPVHLLTTSTPAGFERFVAAVAALGDADPEALTAVAAEHGIEILGPPGMLP